MLGITPQCVGAATAALSGTFVSEWKTDNAGTSAANQITIPTANSGTYAANIDWGDGNTEIIAAWNDAAWTHTYAAAGTYTVTIGGTFPAFQFNNGGDKLKLLKVTELGSVGWLNLFSAFYGCSNLTEITIGDTESTKDVTRIDSFLRGCDGLVSASINGINLTSSTDFRNIFRDSNFNFPIQNWQMPTGTDPTYSMASFAQGNVVFDQELPNLIRTRAMNNAFNGATAFDQDIAGKIGGEVTNITQVCRNATTFNRSMAAMDISKMSAANLAFENTAMSTANYDATLQAWAASPTILPSILIRFPASYTITTSQASRDTLTNAPNNWTIIDGGGI